MEPRVSVIIPVRNACRTIGTCLASLQKLNHSSFEVIVVDDGSSDSTAEIVSSHQGITMLSQDPGGPSRARNRGIEVASGEYVAFTDGDCIVDAEWLTELEKGFSGPEVAGVGGDQISPDDESSFGKSVQDFFKAIGFVTGYIKTDPRMRETEHNPSCNSMYRTEILRSVGGFNESLFPGEDVELDLRITRLGHTLMYNPKASVAHYRPGTWREFLRMMRRYGDCQGRLVRMYGIFRTIQYVPLILVAAALTALGLMWSVPHLWPILLLPLPLLWGWFLFKTRDPGRSIQFMSFAIGTLVMWNLGFIAGLCKGVPNK